MGRQYCGSVYILKILAHDEGTGRGCQSTNTVLIRTLYIDILWNLLSFFICPVFIYYTEEEIKIEEFSSFTRWLVYPYLYTFACVLQTLIAWFLTASTYERWKCVQDPFWSIESASRKRGRLISAGVLFLGIILNIPRIWEWESTTLSSCDQNVTDVDNVTEAINCTFEDSLRKTLLFGNASSWIWTYTGINYIVPSIILIPLNIAISWTIVRRNRELTCFPTNPMSILQSLQYLGILFFLSSLPQLIRTILAEVLSIQPPSYLMFTSLIMLTLNSTLKFFFFYNIGEMFPETVQEQIPIIRRKIQYFMFSVLSPRWT